MTLLPKTWDEAWRVVDEALRKLEEFWTMTPRTRAVTIAIDTGATPYATYESGSLRRAPMGVLLGKAVVQRSATGQAISGGIVTWEFRGGRLLIHTVTGLAATTRYDATILLVEAPNG
jgi:hypothetical protein